MKRDERRIAALLRERDALVHQGKDDRVKQVDEQLKLAGYTPPSKKDGGSPVPTPPKPSNAPQGRSSKPNNQTTA